LIDNGFSRFFARISELIHDLIGQGAAAISRGAASVVSLDPSGAIGVRVALCPGLQTRAFGCLPADSLFARPLETKLTQFSLNVGAQQSMTREIVMSKALILGTVALAFSAVSASAQVYVTPDYGYATPVADFAPPPANGYGAPGYGYAAPGYGAGSTVVIVTPGAPAYTTPYAAPPVYGAPPVTTGYYDSPPIPPAPVYDYAPDYGYGYTPGYWNRGYWGRWYR
jgi:hypothetical protein